MTWSDHNQKEWESRDRATRDLGDRRVAWSAQPGSQWAFLRCPAWECLLEGPRGGGKTDALLMDFAQHVGRGYGQDWVGAIFRQTYPQLQEVIRKSKKFFPRIWPSATYNEARSEWAWATGERLRFTYMEREDDYWNYHGHEYPWMGWEELTTWPNLSCYLVMKSLCRSSNPRVPRKIRATTNPYGPGHNVVRAYWGLPVPPGRAFRSIVDAETGLARVAIHSTLEENLALVSADPLYKKKIAESAANPAQLKAWLHGSWDIVAGGMFDDLWAPRHHVVPDLRPRDVPFSWRLNRSFDAGQSKPFSVGWWAESSGEPMRLSDGRLLGAVPGDLIRFAEWYGWNGRPNEGVRMLYTEIADGIASREKAWGIQDRLSNGVADSSIFDDFEPGKSVAGDMKRRGVRWEPADKRPGSRKQGWEQLRKLLAGAVPDKDGLRERPGLFVCESCEQFVRTVPVLPRSKKDPDDVDTEAEDHVADETRYRVRERRLSATEGGF